jgi:hypothetical protein
MSFQGDKTHLESVFNVLKQQASSTSENWKDSVQTRFYEQYLNQLPKEFLTFTNELNKLDKSFEKAESTINDLQGN